LYDFLQLPAIPPPLPGASLTAYPTEAGPSTLTINM
jgi:hypothetical protein